MTTANKKKLGIVLIVLLAVVFIQVMLGGITRLTGSGLSITEWDVIKGTLPPMGEEAWMDKFEKYQTIPQYQLLNKGMTLSEFKSIFFWEWIHRNWGKWGMLLLLGTTAFFWIKGALNKWAKKNLLILIFLYILQGVLGWFMVMSGLSENVNVSHYRLTAHLLLAIFLFAYILWFIVQLMIKDSQKIDGEKLRPWAWGITAVIVLQIILGAFMSGLKAATHYPTWPDMRGVLVPDNMFFMTPFYKNFLENIATIQFLHRGTAYIIVLLVLYYCWKAWKPSAGTLFRKTLPLLPIILIIQMTLGILTLLYSSNGEIPVALGAIHQSVGLIFLSTMLFLNFLFRPKT